MSKRIGIAMALSLLLGCGGETASSIFTDATQVLIKSPAPCTAVLLTPGEEDDVFAFGPSTDRDGLLEERVFAAIFEGYAPQVMNGKIVNPGDARWVWHSGMRSTASPAAGRVRFVDGTAPDAQGQPTSLQSCRMDGNCANLAARFDRQRGKTYYFAVWAWDENREISYFSDRAMPFCFTNDPAQRGQPCPSSCSQ